MQTAFGLAGLPLSAGGMALLLFCIAGVATIAALARKEMREDLKRRAVLLDEASALFDNPSIKVGSDGYPRLEGTSNGNRVSMEIVPDSLVPRRLPQLWLRLTMLTNGQASRPSIGVLARPVGTEFYSRVLGLPDTVTPPFKADFPMLMRGKGVSEAALRRTSALFHTLFADPALKEAVITPRGTGLVRQIAEGDRGAHILYRQMRFPVAQVSPDIVRNALAELRLLDEALEPAQSGTVA